MTPARQQEIFDRIIDRMCRLYPHVPVEQFQLRLRALIGRYEVGVNGPGPVKTQRWSEKDALLITYGDSIIEPGEFPLVTLRQFLDRYLQQAISIVHVLPFFPYSSDDGFSVINYRKVREDLGEWTDLQAINKHYDLMYDLVINHVSRRSEWFKYYMLDVAPYRDFFIEVDPQTDLSSVVRPRDLPLHTAVMRQGEKRHLWTTFSRDQLDVNFANPDVLFEYLDILVYYICQRARVIRLDAIAYLWKKIGTHCIHLPETHEVVKLFRDLLDLVAPSVILLTETNVPHDENVAYFGDGNEAHMVYQFSLPPLVLHTLLTGSAEALTTWAAQLAPPPHGCTFLNFTASHDGIGVRPLEGLVPPEAFDQLIAAVEKRGGQVSVKRNSDGSTSPYELNITYFSALGPETGASDPLHLDRFICSQIIAASLAGIPAFYVQALIAGENDTAGAEQAGYARAINRKKWDWTELQGLLDNPETHAARALKRLTEVLRARAACPAFHPDAAQEIIKGEPACFMVKRLATDGTEVFALHNVTAKAVSVTLSEKVTVTDLLEDGFTNPAGEPVPLAPYQCRWLLAS